MDDERDFDLPDRPTEWPRPYIRQVRDGVTEGSAKNLLAPKSGEFSVTGDPR